MSLQSLPGKPEDFTAWAKTPPAGGARGGYGALIAPGGAS